MSYIPEKILRFILNILKPYFVLILGKFFICIIWSVDLTLGPYVLKIILNTLPNTSTYKELFWPSLFYILIATLSVIAYHFHHYINVHLNGPLKRDIGYSLMNNAMHRSQHFFQTHFIGNLSSKIENVMRGIPDLLQIIIDRLFGTVLSLSIAIYMVWQISFIFGIIMIGWVIIFLIVSSKLSPKSQQLSMETAEARSNVTGQMIDTLSNILNVFLFAGYSHEKKRIKKSLDTYVKTDQKRGKRFMYLFVGQGWVFFLYQTLTFLFLIHGFIRGYVSVGDFAFVLTLNSSLIMCIENLFVDINYTSEIIGHITQGLNTVLNSPESLDIEKEFLHKKQAEEIHSPKKNLTIEFQNVTFSYASKPLFKNISVSIYAGEKIGLVGYSGSGKSTFAHLILRLFSVTQGRILIGGKDIQNFTSISLRNLISMVPQDSSLFNRTIMENIKYGRERSTDEEAILAAQKANAHEFIVCLENGYDTLVGEKGAKISGGQRQRIAIARAFLKNAPILILDEATSHLDAITEHKIQNALENLSSEKTMLIISHKLSNLFKMRRILVFDQGNIIEEGSHQELIGKKGFYKMLWDTQREGFLPEK